MSVLSERKQTIVLDAMTKGVVTAAHLAKRAGCSERTIYRYINAMRQSGAVIQSEAGVGYLLRHRAPAAEGTPNG